MNKEGFVDPENWRGGSTYQLAMAWPAGDDLQILRAIRALWGAPGIAGPWETPSQFPEPSPLETALDREIGWQSYGLLTVDNDTEVSCRVFAILQEKAPLADRLDWLFVVIHRGMQQKTFDFVYRDQLRKANPWLTRIDEQYVSLAEQIDRAAPFAFAVVDFDGPTPFDHSRELPDKIQSYGSGCSLHKSGI